MFGSTARTGPECQSQRFRTMFRSAGLSRRSSISGLNAMPRQASVLHRSRAGFSARTRTPPCTRSTTHPGLPSLTSRAVRISGSARGPRRR